MTAVDAIVTHAWEAICWAALGIGLFSMALARRWMRTATDSVKESNALLEAAIVARAVPLPSEDKR